jgi:hypothetical protein
MHIITLQDKSHFDYLMFVFHKHVKTGLEPEELSIAGQVWAQLRNVQELEIPKSEGGPEVIQIPGPLTVVHNGDLEVPLDGQP